MINHEQKLIALSSNICKSKRIRTLNFLLSGENEMQKLIKKALAGDKDAFVALIEKNKLQMYKIARCYLISEEDIGDALQETILSCYKNLHTLKKPAFFKTWMIRILINQCKNILRCNQRSIHMEMDCTDMTTEKFDDHLVEFWDIINRLDEKYRAIIVLRYVYGFRIREISEILELNENTVATRLRRGKVFLKKAYRGSDVLTVEHKKEGV